MPVQIPVVNQPFVDPETGLVNRVWYLALLSLNNSVPVNVVTSINLTGLNGITVAGGPVTSAGVITLGIGNLTCASAVVAGTVTAANVVVTGGLRASAVTATGTLSAANVQVSGTVTAANAVIVGTLTAADIVVNATVLAANVRATATITAANVIATGTVTAANVVVTQTVATVGMVATGRIEPSQTIGILGTNTNNDANAGSVGEYISARIQSAAAIPITSGVAFTVTAVPLTAGDWDVSGNIVYLASSTTLMTGVAACISTTSATTPGIDQAENFFNFAASAAGNSQGVSSPVKRVTVNATTPQYLVGVGTFTVSSCTANGEIRARRVR